MRKQNLLDLFYRSLELHNSKVFFQTPLSINKTKNIWTYGSVNKIVNQFNYLFNEYNLDFQDRIVYIGDNSPYWLGANMATYIRNGIFVPIYKSQHIETIEYIVKETEPKIIIGSENLIKKINLELLKKKKIIDIDKFDNENIPEFEKITKNNQYDLTNIILYTSGTTGLVKGVCLNHNNMCSNLVSIENKIGSNFINSTDRYFNFLPWSHIYGLNCELYYGMSKGCSIYINDNIDNLITNMKKAEPSIICTVPKLLYGIYDKIESNKITKIITKEPLNKMFGFYIKNKIFGSNLRFINSGGASISPQVINFFSKLNIPVYQGYGLSETSPIISLNYPNNNKIGSVGKILDCNCVRITDREIYVKGSNVFSEYYKQPTETGNSFDSEGYFKTGDLGFIDDHGYLFITGRSKELYKLSNGKYINPSYIENILMESELIQQIYIYGDSKPYNIGLVVSKSSLQDIKLEIDKLSYKLKKYEIPKKIIMVPQFTFEEKLVTPKLSLVRNNIYKKYKKEISELYS